MEALGSFASSSGGRPLPKHGSQNHQDPLDKSSDKPEHFAPNPNLQVKQKGLLGRMRYHSDLLVELLPNPSDKTSTRLKRYRHECVIGMKASDYMIRVLQKNKGDPARPKKIIKQKLKFSKLCLENWCDLLHSMNPLDRFLTFCDAEDYKQKTEEEPVFYVPIEERRSRKKTVKLVQANIGRPTTKELLPPRHRPIAIQSAHSVKQLLRHPSIMTKGSPDSMGLMLMKPQNTRSAKIKATRMGANLNVTMIMDPVDSESEDVQSPTKINFGFSDWAAQPKEKLEKPKKEVVIAQSAAHRLSEKFMLEEIIYSAVSLLFQRAKVLYLVDDNPESAYKLLVKARQTMKKVCVESMFSSHHYLHIKINLLLGRILLEAKFFKEALKLTWENVSVYRTACRMLFNPELEHTKKVNAKFTMITKHFVLSLYQMSLCYLNLEELSNLAFSVQMMSQICVAHLSRIDELVTKVFQFIENYKLSIEPILFAQRELGSIIQKLYEDIAPPNLDHLIDLKFEAQKLEQPREDDPHTFQAAELAISLGYEPELDHQLEKKKKIQESTKKYIRRLDTVIQKDLDTSLFSSKKLSLGYLNSRADKTSNQALPSDHIIESPLLFAEGPATFAVSEIKQTPILRTTAANSRPGSPPVNFTPVKPTTHRSTDTASPQVPHQSTDSILDTLIDSQQKIHQQTEKKVKPLAKIKILQNPNSNHMMSGRSPLMSKIYATSPRSNSPQSNVKLDSLMGEFYVKPSLNNRSQSPKEWTTCLSDYSLLCQEDHLVRKETRFHKEQFSLRKEVAPAVTDLICEKKKRAPPAYQESLTHQFFEIKAAKQRERAIIQQAEQRKSKLASIRKEANEKFQRSNSGRSPRSSLFRTKISLPEYQKMHKHSESSEQSEDSQGYNSEQREVRKKRVKVQQKLLKVMEAHPETFKVGAISDCRRRLHISPYAFVLHGSSHEYPKDQNHFKNTKDAILKNIGLIEKDTSMQDLRIRKLTDRGIYESNKLARSGSQSPPGLKKLNSSSNLLSVFKKKDRSAEKTVKSTRTEVTKPTEVTQFPKGFQDLYKSTKGLEFQAFQNKESKPFRELFVRLKQGAKLSDFIKKGSTQEQHEASATSDSRLLLTALHGGPERLLDQQTFHEELEFEDGSLLD